jgi:hypothetical protein
MSWREIRDELDDAKVNRGAAMAVAVFTPEHAPAGIEPFDVRYGHVFCVVDPNDPDQATLAAAIRLARLCAVATLAQREDTIDAARVLATVTAIRAELEALRGLKSSLTSISTTATDVKSGLDRLREAILARVTDAETQLRAGDAAA